LRACPCDRRYYISPRGTHKRAFVFLKFHIFIIDLHHTDRVSE
jgi:hypothetical protein